MLLHLIYSTVALSTYFREMVAVASTIRMISVTIDQYAVVDTSATLACHTDTEVSRIYQVKWYHNGREFYRFQPGKEPPAMVFRNNSTRVDLLRSDSSRVVLAPVTRHTAGSYGCEITAAGNFETVTATGSIHVVEFPQKDLYTSYADVTKVRVGDAVRINCTSVRSRPAVTLQWFINDENVDESLLTSFPVITDTAGLKTSVLQLGFTLRSAHFHSDRISLRCAAKITDVYYASRQLYLVEAGRSAQLSCARSAFIGQTEYHFYLNIFCWSMLAFRPILDQLHSH